MKWVASRKKQVLEQIESGTLTASQAFDMWGITTEELQEWQNRFARHGLSGLKTVHVGRLRRKERAA